MTEVTIRPGTPDDSYAAFLVFEETLADLAHRLGLARGTDWSDPEKLARMWAQRGSLYQHLAEHATQFWVAERDGRVQGFSRSLLRDGVIQLTEFFVRPGEQSGGVGRELFRRAFPVAGARRQLIIATIDARAQARYLKAGLTPRFPLYYFWREPVARPLATDLAIEPLPAATPALLDTLGAIDRQVIGYRRDPEHRWLLAARQGHLYRRGGRPVGYGYTGPANGPFALLDAADTPAVLAHAEGEAAAVARPHFGLEVPTVNQAAVQILLARDFTMDGFIALFMTDGSLGQLENYVVASPPFFL